MRSLQPTVSIVRARTARVIRPSSGRTGYDRRVPAMVGARGVHLQVVASRLDDTDGCVDLRERPLSSGDGERIADGPLCSWTGIFERRLSDEQPVVILIDALQHGRVVVWRESLERAEAA